MSWFVFLAQATSSTQSKYLGKLSKALFSGKIFPCHFVSKMLCLGMRCNVTEIHFRLILMYQATHPGIILSFVSDSEGSFTIWPEVWTEWKVLEQQWSLIWFWATCSCSLFVPLAFLMPASGYNIYILWWIATEPTKPYHSLVWQNPVHDI